MRQAVSNNVPATPWMPLGSSLQRPNPVEPNAVQTKHALNNTTCLDGASTQSFRQVFRGGIPTQSSVHRSGEICPAKRRQNDDGNAFDLPKLPVRAGKDRRPRLPPTLSGLHHPPPNAGLLPSISIGTLDQAHSEHQVVPSTDRKDDQDISTDFQSQAISVPAKKNKLSRNKWSEEETVHLLKGVARFGIGSWTKILKCADYHFEQRTALDLKDRFRVCCPEQYRKTSHPSTNVNHTRIDGRERVTPVDLEEIGIREPFKKTARRQRHGYSSLEDEALLKGFRKYGNAWTRIRQDVSLKLNHRTATDLRDRMRTRYPSIYKPAKVQSPAEKSPRTPDQHERQARGKDESSGKRKGNTREQTTPDSNARPTRQNGQARHPTSNLFATDPYLSLPFEETENEAGPITLDRGILDWALDKPAGPSDAGRQTIPDHHKPSKTQAFSMSRSITTTARAPQPINTSAPLPSLATITGISANALGDDTVQAELPSLMHYFTLNNDVEDRTSSHTFPSLEELFG